MLAGFAVLPHSWRMTSAPPRNRRKLPLFSEEAPSARLLRVYGAAYIAYALLLAVSVFMHCMWADEADPWVMARETNFHDFLRYFSYVGHPPLWFSLLFPFARLGLPIETMQGINAVLALMVAWLLLYRSPFAPWLRVALLFTQGLSFQYAVVARSYMLMLFILFLLAACHPSRLQRPWRYSALLALGFCTESFAMPAIGMLLLFFAWDAWQQPQRGRYLPPLALAAFGGLLSVASLLPFDGMNNMQGFYKNPKFYQHAFLKNIVGGFFPWALWRHVRMHFPLVDELPWRFVLWVPIGASVMALALLASAPRWRLLLLAWLSGFFYIFSFVYFGQTWHAQLMPLFTIWTLWMHRAHGQATPPTPWQRRAATCLPFALLPGLVFSLASSLTVHREDMLIPYSGGKEIADYIRETGRDKTLLTSLACFNTSTMAGYLPGTPLWIAGNNRFASYIIWGRHQDECNAYFNKATPIVIERAKQEKLLVLTTAPVNFPPPLQAQLLKESYGTHESFLLYEVEAK